MSEITFVLIFILVLILIAVYLGHKYIVIMETQLKEAEQKNSMMSLFLIKKDLYAEYITWKNTYKATDFLSDVNAAISEKNNTNSTKDNV